MKMRATAVDIVSYLSYSVFRNNLIGSQSSVGWAVPTTEHW
ncbi:hypothetical protein [[Phormidium] sp. ETS-05]|nr:hypothetical protein [[Phormidium] sp. ETS-05]